MKISSQEGGVLMGFPWFGFDGMRCGARAQRRARRGGFVFVVGGHVTDPGARRAPGPTFIG